MLGESTDQVFYSNFILQWNLTNINLLNPTFGR